jgi:hypothetical protein
MLEVDGSSSRLAKLQLSSTRSAKLQLDLNEAGKDIKPKGSRKERIIAALHSCYDR